MINSILVGVDSSAYGRAALRHAVELASVYKAQLTGLHVLDVRYLEMPPYLDYSYAFEAVPPVVVPPEVTEQFRAKCERLLEDVRRTAEARGVTVSTRAEEGVPGQVLADVGRSCDLLVIGKRGEHAKWARDLLGSTAEAVVRRSSTPVMLAEHEFRIVGRVVVLFDGSDPAKRALELAADLAGRLEAEMVVLTVDDDAERGRQVLNQAAVGCEALGTKVSFHLRPGKTVKATLAFLAEEPADLVILGMRGHSPLRELILGRTTEQLMRQVKLPVVLVP